MSVSELRIMVAEPHIDTDLVRNLVKDQFPGLMDHDIRPVHRQGWDNRMYRLGQHLVVRLPSAARYAAQVEKEQTWLPRIAGQVSLSVPVPVAMGRPSSRFPFAWSIMEWMDGHTASVRLDLDYAEFAVAAATFLRSLWAIDAQRGPKPGAHNFQRGGALAFYDGETREMLAQLSTSIDRGALTDIWDRALSSGWDRPGVWVHGDFAPGNLLVHQGKLSGVIDFGGLGVGDPACDLVLCWTLLPDQCRERFRHVVDLDADTWARARGWALWKALLMMSDRAPVTGHERAHTVVLGDLLREHHSMGQV